MLSERLKIAMREAGVTQAELARRCGVKPSSIHGWLSGKSKFLRGENLLKAAKALNVQQEWLATGKGVITATDRPMAESAQGINPQGIIGEVGKLGNVQLSHIGPAGKVPLISWVQAGNWCEAIDNFAPGDADEWYMCPVNHSESTYVLQVRGESMYNPSGRPSFQEGDLIFVDPQRSAEHGSLVVVRLDDEKEVTFKKLIIEGGKKYLKALNPDWPEPIIPINGNATMCGVVIFKGEKL
jgi:SOS-response transcriptional repressor LexA